MARLSAIFLAFLLGAASSVALVSCGGGNDAELLPGRTADQIESNLDQVAELAGEDDCIGAEDAVAEVAAEVEELQGVDLKLKAALEEGTAQLSAVVGRCEEETSEETEPTLETTVEADELEEEEKKPEKDKKAEKEEEEAAEQEEEPAPEEGHHLPPQSQGQGEENGQGGGEPPVEAETPEETPSSGGVGPSVGVEKE
jgi:hypothetical protein